MGNIAPSLIYNVGILFVMMIPGILLKKCGLSTDGIGKGISNLVLYIAQPALVFLAYLRPYDSKILVNAAYVLLFSVVAHGIFALVTMNCYKKAPDSAKRMLRFATIFSNAAFMGIPLIDAVLGNEATLYASVYNITFNLFLWSLGVHICTSNRDYDGDGDVDQIDEGVERLHKNEASVKKALLHPVTIAAALGLICFFFLPSGLYSGEIQNRGYDFAIDCLTMLKNLVAPLSMTVIGLRLADISFKGFFKDKNLYVFLALRHILLPAAVFFVMRLLTLVGLNIDKQVIAVVLIMACAPAASSATMFAEKYDCDASYVSKIVAVSTILSLLTMPLMVLLLNL